MKLNTPRWWYRRDRRDGAVTRMALKPLSWVWAWATARRLARGRPIDPGAPVISIGNLTVGGSGKTPVAREIARLLEARGARVALLSRGYGGSLEGPLRVDPALHDAGQVGDEPLMLARDREVWIARDRPAGARAAVEAGAQVVVMDDGHQNPALKKALSLVVVDGETRHGEWPFGDGGVFPSGPMREPLAKGLARADLAVVLLPPDMDTADPELLEVLAPTPVVVARLVADHAPPAGPVVAFAGIAKPWKFERALQAAGADLADFIPFADHATFAEKDLDWLAERARQFEARLLTTEKDWARLPVEWRQRVDAWPVRAVFEANPRLESALDQITAADAR